MQLASPLVRAAVTLEDEACAPAGTAPAPRLAADLVPRLAGARGAPRWKSFAPPLVGAAHRRPSSAGPRDAPMCVSSSTTDSAPHAVSDLDEEEEVAVQWGLAADHERPRTIARSVSCTSGWACAEPRRGERRTSPACRSLRALRIAVARWRPVRRCA